MKEYKLTAHYGDYVLLYCDKGYQYRIGSLLDFNKGYFEDHRTSFFRHKIRENSNEGKVGAWNLNFKTDISLKETCDALMSEDFEIVKIMMDIILNNKI